MIIADIMTARRENSPILTSDLRKCSFIFLGFLYSWESMKYLTKNHMKMNRQVMYPR